MNREELFNHFDRTTERCRKIMQAKNQDYAHEDADPFANFRASETFGIAPEKGIMLRMQDKMNRIVSFLERGDLKVPNESVLDATDDLLNYSVLLSGMLMQKLSTPKKEDELSF